MFHIFIANLTSIAHTTKTDQPKLVRICAQAIAQIGIIIEEYIQHIRLNSRLSSLEGISHTKTYVPLFASDIFMTRAFLSSVVDSFYLLL